VIDDTPPPESPPPPPWVPPAVWDIAQAISIDREDNPGVATRLVRDPRMESVWKWLKRCAQKMLATGELQPRLAALPEQYLLHYWGLPGRLAVLPFEGRRWKFSEDYAPLPDHACAAFCACVMTTLGVNNPARWRQPTASRKGSGSWELEGVRYSQGGKFARQSRTLLSLMSKPSATDIAVATLPHESCPNIACAPRAISRACARTLSSSPRLPRAPRAPLLRSRQWERRNPFATATSHMSRWPKPVACRRGRCAGSASAARGRRTCGIAGRSSILSIHTADGWRQAHASPSDRHRSTGEHGAEPRSLSSNRYDGWRKGKPLAAFRSLPRGSKSKSFSTRSALTQNLKTPQAAAVVRDLAKTTPCLA
jgi:hypothetical protein